MKLGAANNLGKQPPQVLQDAYFLGLERYFSHLIAHSDCVLVEVEVVHLNHHFETNFNAQRLRFPGNFMACKHMVQSSFMLSVRISPPFARLSLVKSVDHRTFGEEGSSFGVLRPPKPFRQPRCARRHEFSVEPVNTLVIDLFDSGHIDQRQGSPVSKAWTIAGNFEGLVVKMIVANRHRLRLVAIQMIARSLVDLTIRFARPKAFTEEA